MGFWKKGVSAGLVVSLLLLANLAPAAGARSATRRGFGSRELAGSRVGIQAPAGQSREAKMPALTPVGPDALTSALQRGALTEARYALLRALTLFHLRDVRARYGNVRAPAPRDATMILRDLVVRYRDLSPADRRTAGAILARPDDGAADPGGDGYAVPAVYTCSTNFCIHWVASTLDAPALTDSDADTIPDWVETTLTALENVWANEVVSYAYRAPKSDLTSTNHGPDGRVDVYLANIGDQGLYGYCTSDDPNLANPAYQYWDMSAYCVLDNDYSAIEFPPPATSGVAGMEVTAAHEFFHAVQFAYDAFEDRWFMEGTSTWMEDEVYDDVNDNIQYLSESALSVPEVPVDNSDYQSFFLYGNWIFWRFLAEYVGTAAAADPTVVRDTWIYADGSALGPDMYSAQAAAQVMSDRDWRFRWAFADFGAVNAVPETFYEEGASYPSAPISKTFAMTARRWATGWWYATLDHLTNGYAAFRPSSGVRSNAKLWVEVDLPSYSAGSEATLVVIMRSGGVRFMPFNLDNRGRGTKKAPFGKGDVTRVILVLTNASTRYSCWQSTVYSCQGVPRDDNERFNFDAWLVQ